MGYILLEGGAEFGGQMATPDLRAMELAGGPQARLRVIPAAAAPDDNHQRAGRNAERWFRKLGATDAAVLPLIDRQSAENLTLADTLRESQLIYMLGGFPQHLAQSLAGTAAWQAICRARQSGAVIGGSSAGAMVLCEYFYNSENDRVLQGLGLVKGACVLPHHDTFGSSWAPRLRRLLPEIVMIGIDEETGVIDDAASGHWRVYGKGTATRYHHDRVQRFGSADEFSMP
jgi:cyanophycinase